MNDQETKGAVYGLGLVIGKFLPPHHGHEHLIRTALARSRRLEVIICGKPDDPVPPDLRVEWLRELFPNAAVRAIDDRYDENDSRVWAENTINWLGRAPDAVFTSESYGEPYAAYLGCHHVLVDQARLAFPVSGTAVRADPLGQWNFLSGPVRGWYARRIVIVGAESTGTTTLAQNLAEHFQTNWVSEYGREYSLLKQKRGDRQWHCDEFVEIAAEQTRREDAAARICSGLLVCDTNALATVLWHRRYMGGQVAALDALGRSVRADLYFLTGDEIPFVQDGLRDGEHIRHENARVVRRSALLPKDSVETYTRKSRRAVGSGRGRNHRPGAESSEKFRLLRIVQRQIVREITACQRRQRSDQRFCPRHRRAEAVPRSLTS